MHIKSPAKFGREVDAAVSRLRKARVYSKNNYDTYKKDKVWSKTVAKLEKQRKPVDRIMAIKRVVEDELVELLDYMTANFDRHTEQNLYGHVRSALNHLKSALDQVEEVGEIEDSAEEETEDGDPVPDGGVHVNVASLTQSLDKQLGQLDNE